MKSNDFVAIRSASLPNVILLFLFSHACENGSSEFPIVHFVFGFLFRRIATNYFSRIQLYRSFVSRVEKLDN